MEAATSELREAFGVSLSDIGVIIEAGVRTEGEGALVAVDEEGAERPLPIEGWDHFR